MKRKNNEYSIPHHGLSGSEKAKADNELRIYRLERLKRISENQKVYADLISLKYSILDYLEIGIFLRIICSQNFSKNMFHLPIQQEGNLLIIWEFTKLNFLKLSTTKKILVLGFYIELKNIQTVSFQHLYCGN